MSHTAIYQFPQLKDLPNGLSMALFARKGGIYPGTCFEAFDTGEYHTLMFPSGRFLNESDEHEDKFIPMTMNDVISVTCKKVKDV